MNPTQGNGEYGSIFSKVPDCLLEIILNYVPGAKNMLRVSQVCRRWRDICQKGNYLGKHLENSLLHRSILKKYDVHFSIANYFSFFLPYSPGLVKTRVLKYDDAFLMRTDFRLQCFDVAKELCLESIYNSRQRAIHAKNFQSREDRTFFLDKKIVQVSIETLNNKAYLLEESGNLKILDYDIYPLRNSIPATQVKAKRRLCYFSDRHNVYQLDPKSGKTTGIALSRAPLSFFHLSNEADLFTSYHLEDISFYGDKRGNLYQWSLHSNEVVTVFPSTCARLIFSENSILASSGSSGIQLFDMRTAKEIACLKKAKELSQLELHDAGLFAIEEQSFKIWDIRNLCHPFFILEGNISQFAYLEDLFLFAYEDHIRLYSFQKKESFSVFDIPKKFMQFLGSKT